MSTGESETLDLRGLKMPLACVDGARHLDRARLGSGIVVLTDDPMAPVDIPHIVRKRGYEVLAVERSGSEARMILRRPAVDRQPRG